MVINDMGLPDPDHPEDLKISSQIIDMNINSGSDDSDQEIEYLDTAPVEYVDYQPLSTVDESDYSDINYQEINSGVLNEASTISSLDISVPSITPMESILLEEVWSGPPPLKRDIEMDSKKVDEVKEAMSTVTLPASAIPDWAVNIPEEEWKIQLIKRLGNTDKHTP